MAALAEAADYAPASLYTYFSSRTALIGALQVRALAVLRTVAEERMAACDLRLGPPRTARERRAAALARLLDFADLFVTAPDHHPREFRLQQELLVDPQTSDDGPSPEVIASAMAVLELPRRLLEEAVACGALERAPRVDPVDGSMVRTLAWITAMNGALLLDRLDVGTPVAGAALGMDQTRALLLGWGADRQLLGAIK
jgi:AcrR family transcriptional regulator